MDKVTGFSWQFVWIDNPLFLPRLCRVILRVLKHPKSIEFLVSPLIVGFIVSGAVFGAEVWADKQRDEREHKYEEVRAEQSLRLENLRFVRERSGQTFVERPFAGLDLRGLVLNGLQLAQSDFSSANFDESIMMGGDVHESDFSSATMKRAFFIHVKMDESDFSYADMRDATFESIDFSKVDLHKANVSGADLRLAINLPLETKSIVCYDSETQWPSNFPGMDRHADLSICQFWHELDAPITQSINIR